MKFWTFFFFSFCLTDVLFTLQLFFHHKNPKILAYCTLSLENWGERKDHHQTDNVRTLVHFELK